MGRRNRIVTSKREIILTVNGVEKTAYIRHADTLLHILREQFGIKSVKTACHNGDCGACTILIDEIPFNSCHMLGVEADGRSVITIEGLHDNRMQESFIQNWAIQCGYCTPGFILNCYGLMKKFPDADDAMIDDWLDSNICRCTGYQEIKESVKQVLLSNRKSNSKMDDQVI